MLKTSPTAEPSTSVEPMKKHVFRRRRNEDGTWGKWEETTLCGKRWDRPFLPGSPSCAECQEKMEQEIREERCLDGCEWKKGAAK